MVLTILTMITWLLKMTVLLRLLGRVNFEKTRPTMKAWMRQPSTACSGEDQDEGDPQREQHIDHGHGGWFNALYLLTDRRDLLTSTIRKVVSPPHLIVPTTLWRQVLTPHQEHA